MSAVEKSTIETSEKEMGILKFHNLELFLSLNEKKIDPSKVSAAISNLKQSISMIEASFSEASPRNDVLKLVTEKEKEEIKKKRFSSDHYFTAKNHLDLFNVGNFYFEQYQKGKRNFALYADKEFVLSHGTLLGLASYFNYHENIKATIVIDNFANSFFSRQLTKYKREVRCFNNENTFYEVIVSDGVEIIEFASLHHLSKKIERENFEELIEVLFKEVEISFWDFPDLKNIDCDKEFYFPLIQKVDSFTALLSPGKSKASVLKSFLSYAKKYSMKIDGVLFDKAIKEKNE